MVKLDFLTFEARVTNSQNINFHGIIAFTTAGKNIRLSLSFSYCISILMQWLEIRHKDSQNHKLKFVILWRLSSQTQPTQRRVSNKTLFRAMFPWIFNISMDRDSITSLADLFNCLTTFAKSCKKQNLYLKMDFQFWDLKVQKHSAFCFWLIINFHPDKIGIIWVPDRTPGQKSLF